jgi:hypothetical protein
MNLQIDLETYLMVPSVRAQFNRSCKDRGLKIALFAVDDSGEPVIDISDFPVIENGYCFSEE